MFIVCGEALFDVYAEQDSATASDTVSRHLSLQAHVGGSPFNVAVGMARLGESVALLSGLANDFLGEHLHAVLEQEGVSTRLIARKTAPTTLSFVQHDADGVPSYAFYGNGAADRVLDKADTAFALAGVRGLHLGSYSMVVEPAASAYIDLLREQSGQRLIALDPNVRLNVEPDLDVWRSRLSELLPHLDLIKVSDEDLAALYPGQEPDSIMQAWQIQGIHLLALTRGAAGASLWCGALRVDIAALSIEVVDTVGAGDTFQAALLQELLQHGWPQTEAELKHLGQFAATAAAITCSRRGANLPTRAEVLAQLEQH